MAFRKNKPVPLSPLGVGGFMPHFGEIEDCYNICSRQGTTGMAGARFCKHLQNFHPEASCLFRKLVNIFSAQLRFSSVFLLLSM